MVKYKVFQDIQPAFSLWINQICLWRTEWA